MININNKLLLLHNIFIIIANCYYMLIYVANIIYEIFKNKLFLKLVYSECN